MLNKLSTITFGELVIPENRPYIIAEAGVNHENDLNIALSMIEQAAISGADAIKFQSYKAGSLASKYSPSYWNLANEPTTSQFELFSKYDSFSANEYITLARKAQDCKIHFLCTPFDEYFADILEPYVPAFKIASADITNLPFLSYCASKGKPIILSTGASTIIEIEEAINTIKDTGNEKIALLHCVLSYPCESFNANLNVIKHLQESFPNCVIGYSDHVPPDSCGSVITTAWLLGARIIEKHFTLNKTLPGNDHYHAMDPQDLTHIKKQIEFISSIVGNSSKIVFDCETESRKHARRSLVANRAIRMGEIINQEDVSIKRPGTGIQPKFLLSVTGSFASCDIEEDQILQWEMINKMPS